MCCCRAFVILLFRLALCCYKFCVQEPRIYLCRRFINKLPCLVYILDFTKPTKAQMIIYALAFWMKENLCLDVVKQTLKNYVNVAMMWTDIYVWLPYRFSLFFAYTETCGRNKGRCIFVPVTYMPVCSWLFYCCDKTSALWFKGEKYSIYTPICQRASRALFSNMQTGFSCKKANTAWCTHTSNPICIHFL